MLVGFHQRSQERAPSRSPRSFKPRRALGVLANRISRIREVSSRKRNDRGGCKRRRNLRRISGAAPAHCTRDRIFRFGHTRKGDAGRRQLLVQRSLNGYSDSARNSRADTSSTLNPNFSDRCVDVNMESIFLELRVCDTEYRGSRIRRTQCRHTRKFAGECRNLNTILLRNGSEFCRNYYSRPSYEK